jgi:hypothetical protein
LSRSLCSTWRIVTAGITGRKLIPGFPRPQPVHGLASLLHSPIATSSAAKNAQPAKLADLNVACQPGMMFAEVAGENTLLSPDGPAIPCRFLAVSIPLTR